MYKWIENSLIKAAIIFMILLLGTQFIMLNETARSYLSIVDRLEGPALK